ncbi:MAG TPA: diguanylate cyclase [Bacillus bacterium]|nr:diguanylate cyclase [Bacillus sp. (in: firmicutes)]
MEELCFKEFFNKSPIAYSCHKIRFDDYGVPYDYKFLLINRAFENLMNIKGADLINKTHDEVFPHSLEGEDQWGKLFQDFIVNPTPVQLDIYHPSLQKRIRIQIFPLCREIFGCIYHDVTELYKNNQSLTELTKILERKNKILNDLAIRDELTGLYNRHFLDRCIENEMNRADRENQPLSMVIFDLDRFKRVNDIWGHPVGDEVLKQTASLANSLISDPDFLVRLGGEEFVIIMPDKSIEEAYTIAENIRQTMEKYKYPIIGHLTASFGVAERIESETYYSWYKRTDKAMYRAKECGRNRVHCSEEQERLLNAPMKIEWKKEWESGNPEIDVEHRELVEKANTLIYLSLSNIEKEKIIHQVDIILNDIINHFRDEEQILLEIGYPDYEKHAEIHTTLLDKVFQFKKAFQNGELKLTEFFSFIINDIIVGHVQYSDAEYFPYTRKAILSAKKRG